VREQIVEVGRLDQRVHDRRAQEVAARQLGADDVEATIFDDALAQLAVVLVERGSGLDVVSGGELERARAAGCPMDRVVYAGVGKTDAEIRAALAGGPGAVGGSIAWFNVESEEELEVIEAIARQVRVPARCALRVNPDVDPKTHAYTATGKKESKFGVDAGTAREVFRRHGRGEWARLRGVHLHIGSPIYETGPYVDAIGKALRLVDELEADGFEI